MKDYKWQIIFLNKLPELVSNLVRFIGSAVLMGENHVVVQVSSSK